MPDSQKVLFVVPLPPPYAGVETISQVLINSPLNASFSVHVLKANVRSSNSTKGQWDVAGIVGVLHIAAKLFFQLLFTRPRLVYLTLSQNATGLCRDIAYLMICRGLSVPIVGHLHGSKLHEFLDLQPSWRRHLFKKGLSLVDRFIVSSESIKLSLLPHLTPSRLHVLYNGLPRPAEPRGKDNKSSAGFNILFIGHLSIAKGFYDLLAAAEKVLQSQPGIRFTFIGERIDNEKNIHLPNSGTPQKHQSWALAEKLLSQYPSHIVIKSEITRQDKLDLLNGADIFILPSYAEAFPVSVLEAMQKGIPLIVTPVGALPEVLKNEENCLFVRIGSVEEISAAITKIHADAPLRDRMSKANRRDSENLTDERMARELGSIFHELTPSIKS